MCVAAGREKIHQAELLPGAELEPRLVLSKNSRAPRCLLEIGSMNGQVAETRPAFLGGMVSGEKTAA
jgi:hypothetical protein